MLNRQIIVPAVSLLFCCVAVAAQDRRADVQAIKASPAYAEILLRKTEVQAELEALLQSYTEAHPKVVELRWELTALEQDVAKVMAVRSSEAGKLTTGLGKLIVRRAALHADLERLTRSYNKDHPDVKRAQRRVEYFEAAIAEILK